MSRNRRNKWTGVNRARARAKRAGGSYTSAAEKRYASQLELRYLAGEILWWKHQPINLRLGDNTFYKPDFMVVTPDMLIELHEVKGAKGFGLDAKGLVKIRAAAEAYPFLPFLSATRAGRGFRIEVHEPHGEFPRGQGDLA